MAAAEIPKGRFPSCVSPEERLMSVARRISMSARASSCSTRHLSSYSHVTALRHTNFFAFDLNPEDVCHQNVVRRSCCLISRDFRTRMPSLGQKCAYSKFFFWGAEGGRFVQHTRKGLEILIVLIHLLFRSTHTRTHPLKL
jgi:hypothetical protein